MKQLLKYAIQIFIAFALIVLTLLWIVYRQPAREYLLTRGDEQIVVVGETHMHSPMEFDRSIDSIVIPALLASRRALFEGALPEKNWDVLRPLFSIPCSSSTAPASIDGAIWNHGKTVYKQDTFDAINKFITVIQEKNPELVASMAQADPMWRQPDASKVLSEYNDVALWQLTDNAYGTIIENFDHQRKRPKLAGDVGLSYYLWDYLDNLNKKFTNMEPKPVHIETIQDRWLSICQATPTRRDEFIRAMFQFSGERVAYEAARHGDTYEPEVTVASEDLLSRALSCINSDKLCSYIDIFRDDALLNKGLIPRPTTAFYSIVISNRNKIMASRVVSEVQQYKRVFLIVGASHLPDFMVDGAAQKGLLSMLAAEGFSIKPIRYRWDMRRFIPTH